MYNHNILQPCKQAHILGLNDILNQSHFVLCNVKISKSNDIIFSAVKLLISINRIKNKVFIYMCVCTVYIYYAYINTHTHAFLYLRKNVYLYITLIFYYINIHVNTCKYFLNIYCMSVCLYIINKHSPHTYIMSTKTYFGCDSLRLIVWQH